MILGLGIDIIENHRIDESWQRYGERFLERIYSPEEVAYCLGKANPAPYLAVRFAAKEAFIKALSVKPGSGIGYREITVTGRGKGKKKIALSGLALEAYNSLGANHIHLSLSHSEDFSTAAIILEQR